MAFPRKFRLQRPFTRILDTNGDGTGSTNGAQDFSVTPGTFYIEIPDKDIMSIWNLIVYIEDTDVSKPARYGDLTALSTGVIVRLANDDITRPLTDIPIKSNRDWMMHADAPVNPLNAAQKALKFVWPLTFSDQAGLVMAGRKNTRLEVVLADDFSGLSQHKFSVNGFWEIVQ